MSDKPQSYASHSRFDPLFHFVLVPVLLFIFIGSIVGLFTMHHSRHFHILLAVFSLLLLITAGRARSYSLRVQDRVIRLEERLRLAALLPAPLLPRSAALTERQLISLRFASDAELPALVEKTLSENLQPKDIKKQIQNWRPDYWRV
jgi:hypothetical protein